MSIYRDCETRFILDVNTRSIEKTHKLKNCRKRWVKTHADSGMFSCELQSFFLSDFIVQSVLRSIVIVIFCQSVFIGVSQAPPGTIFLFAFFLQAQMFSGFFMHQYFWALIHVIGTNAPLTLAVKKLNLCLKFTIV